MRSASRGARMGMFGWARRRRGARRATHRSVRIAIVAVVLAGCAHGIVQDLEATDAPEAVVAPMDASVEASIDVSAPDVVDASLPETPTSCEATANDDACFDCCDAKYPKADDLWLAALDACCPNDECTDDQYDACETKADDACAKDPECIGRDTCEETSGCWEKVSSGP